MAFIEISELQETLNIDSNSVFPVVFQGETKKITFQTLKSAMQYFNAVSFNSSTGQFTFGRSNNSNVLLSTDFNNLIKDVEVSNNGKLVFTREDDTTKEIDVSIGDGTITAEKLSQELQTKINSIDDKVDKVSGKGLSTNDYTDADKNKLDGINLSNYVTNTDYATSGVGGVVKVGSNAVNIGTGGFLSADTRTYDNYFSAGNSIFIGKGTLENVLNARIGDINTILDNINGEVV